MNTKRNPMQTAAAAALLGAALLVAPGQARDADAALVGGPVYDHREIVEAYSTDVYWLEFYGGELASIAVYGDGDTDLDLYVYDQWGNLICTDADYTDVMFCNFVPYRTGEYRVEIQNLGRIWNEYLMDVE